MFMVPKDSLELELQDGIKNVEKAFSYEVPHSQIVPYIYQWKYNLPYIHNLLSNELPLFILLLQCI